MEEGQLSARLRLQRVRRLCDQLDTETEWFVTTRYCQLQWFAGLVRIAQREKHGEPTLLHPTSCACLTNTVLPLATCISHRPRPNHRVSPAHLLFFFLTYTSHLQTLVVVDCHSFAGSHYDVPVALFWSYSLTSSHSFFSVLRHCLYIPSSTPTSARTSRCCFDQVLGPDPALRLPSKLR